MRREEVRRIIFAVIFEEKCNLENITFVSIRTIVIIIDEKNDFDIDLINSLDLINICSFFNLYFRTITLIIEKDKNDIEVASASPINPRGVLTR